MQAIVLYDSWTVGDSAWPYISTIKNVQREGTVTQLLHKMYSDHLQNTLAAFSRVRTQSYSQENTEHTNTVCLSVCLPVCLPVCLSACLSACLSVCLSLL